MSGLSQNALAELSSKRYYDDRVPHFCNMLRFSVLKRNNSLMAIGGPWDAIDGIDPSVDDSSLIQTALRFVPWGIFLICFCIFSLSEMVHVLGMQKM